MAEKIDFGELLNDNTPTGIPHKKTPRFCHCRQYLRAFYHNVVYFISNRTRFAS